LPRAKRPRKRIWSRCHASADPSFLGDCAAAAILAIGVILWALAMMGQINDLKAERDVQDQQIVQMEQERQHYLAQTAALVHPLISTTASSGDAAGMIYLDPDPAGQGVW